MLFSVGCPFEFVAKPATESIILGLAHLNVYYVLSIIWASRMEVNTPTASWGPESQTTKVYTLT